MKSTGTKRILSVLSAGALVATMSAIPAFATVTAEATVTKINLSAEPANIEESISSNTQWSVTGFPTITGVDVKITTNDDADPTNNVTDAVGTIDNGSLPTAKWTVKNNATGSVSTNPSNLNPGTYTVTLDKTAFAATADVTITEGSVSQAGATIKVPAELTMPSFTVKITEKQTVVLPEAGAKSVSIKAMTGDDAKTEIAKLNAGITGLKTFTVTSISVNEDGADSPITNTALEAGKTYYALCKATAATDGYELPSADTFILKVSVSSSGVVSATRKVDYVMNTTPDTFVNVDAFIKADAVTVEGVDTIGAIVYKESTIDGNKVTSPNVSGANASDKVKAGDKIVAEVPISAAKPGYTAPTGGNITYTVNVVAKGSSSNDDGDSDTGSSSDTTTDFTKDEMDTSTVSGNTFNHAKPEVLQSRLNDNKGTSISIGEVKNGTATVASFAVTLPKNSGNVSENKVAQVINVLNTISTKSASKNAQSAVNELMKSADDKNTASMPISFSKSMADFGMTVSVTVPVTSKFTNGGTTLYYYNSSSKKLEAQKTTVAIRGGKATFDLTHASEYFLIQGVKDLSAGEGTNDSEDTLSSTEATTVATSEAPVVTAPEVTEPAPVDTTVPSVATNPGTGNAPIALAAIPVAIAAAAIIAKKMK